MRYIVFDVGTARSRRELAHTIISRLTGADAADSDQYVIAFLPPAPGVPADSTDVAWFGNVFLPRYLVDIVRVLLVDARKIQAIKLVRGVMQLSLRQSKGVVDDIQAVEQL